MVFNIKSFRPPVDHLPRKLVRDVHFFHPLSELKSSTAYYCYLLLTRLGLQMEEIAEEIEMGLDAQKSFAQVHED